MKLNLNSIKKEIEQELHQSRIKHKKLDASKYVHTGIPGLDELFENGIPLGSNVLVAGGAGSGKTIMCLQSINHLAKQKKKCLYMSFEESDVRLIKHMEDFGWNPKQMQKDNLLKIVRLSPFDISRSIDALLAKVKGELMINIKPVILPKGYKPDFVVIDSLTAVASAFTRNEDSYRLYIEQLFRFFEELGTTSFLITETTQIPDIYSTTGVEEFLADGVIALYNFKKGEYRENAIEILKMRGEKHRKKIVAMQITDKGMVVYPDQESFAE